MKDPLQKHYLSFNIYDIYTVEKPPIKTGHKKLW